MGVTTEFIRGAIDDGELEAEDVTMHGRRIIRIYPHEFDRYLARINWRRRPRPTADRVSVALKVQ